SAPGAYLGRFHPEAGQGDPEGKILHAEAPGRLGFLALSFDVFSVAAVAQRSVSRPDRGDGFEGVRHAVSETTRGHRRRVARSVYHRGRLQRSGGYDPRHKHSRQWTTVHG